MTDHGANAVEELPKAADSHDILSLLSSPDRYYLVRNSGDQVKIDGLKGKKVGLYFSASWCGPCHRFTPKLVDVYNGLSAKGEFEIVFISADEDDESFNEYFSKMPWLAVPFSDSTTREGLNNLFKVRGVPNLVLLDETGKVLTDGGVEIILEYGVEGYPFTPDRVKELKEQEEAARRDQSLRSILVSLSRDYVISADGKMVPITELEGKTVGLYFSLSSYQPCAIFSEKLIKVYEYLKEKGERFEIVSIPLDDEDEESFKQGFEGAPWLSLPFKDHSCEKLVRYFELSSLPTLVILGPDGKTLHPNVAAAIEEHGSLAYPFTPTKLSELEEIEKAKRETQTLESILISGDQNFVIGKDGCKIPVSDLVGKTILLYFSAHWCPPCRGFTPKLIEVYHKIKSKHDAFEIIFISSDRDQTSFDEYFSGMPWLALPFGDTRKACLSKLFKVRGIPKLVAIGPTGRTVTTEARDLVMLHGADAYPFTEQRLEEIEAEYEEMAKGWPEKVKYSLHVEHELVLTRSQVYLCDSCDEGTNPRHFHLPVLDFWAMPINQITVGRYEEFRHPGALKAAAAEFFSTLIFVFAGQGSGLAFSKLTDGGATTPSGLVAAALAHGFGLFVAVSVAANISGGHVNPAVTFGAFIGGNLTLIRGILYIIAQLLGSIVACLLLSFVTGGLPISAFALSGVSVWSALVFEIVMTFGLVYTVYATALDPKKGELGIIAPIAIGFIVGANILAGGAFTGASMNPAVSFGPALVSWDWTNHWVYWAGPLVGGGLAAIIYELFLISGTHEPVPVADF